jgi:uncharacterized membrane-anchored protein YjiN (DUF445 family)
MWWTMSDSVLMEVAKQVPFAVILFGVIVIFLRHLEKLDDKRIAQDTARMAHEKEMEILRMNSAKERETERRAFDTQVNGMWANSIKEILQKQDANHQLLVDHLKEMAKAFGSMLEEHDRNDEERYKNMGITQNLLEAAKDQIKGKR